ncbi:hypothetical protein [Enhygromyxa salina]|nr:hypothetical protein [Enhygromyxa salina]
MICIALVGGVALGGCDAEELERAEDLMAVEAANQAPHVPVLDDLAPPGGDNGNLKLCTIWFDSPNYWRESFTAPQEWNGSNCDAYRKGQGATWYSLTCLTSSGFQSGKKGGALPPGNLCGW